MIEFVETVLAEAARYTPLLLGCVFLAAVADAALGIGALLPGELAIVLAATALAHDPGALAIAVVLAAAGAFSGDHIGFGAGRAIGPRIGQTRFVARMGEENWDRARRFVGRRFWPMVFGRLLPGVRTLFAAAAGASSMPYRRFAFAGALDASAWAIMWVLGSALLGRTVLELAGQALIPTLLLIAVAAAAACWFYQLRKRRAR